MRTRQQLMQEYLKSHRNPINSMIHVLCVPVIVFSSIGLAWAVPLGRWLGLPADLAPYLNLATILALPLGLYYLRLSFASLITMTVWFALSVAGILAIQAAGAPLLPISAALWLLAWAVQVYGHKVEGAKPSFADDVVFLLIGPLFVTDKLYRRRQSSLATRH